MNTKPDAPFEMKYEGYCPICEAPTTFLARDRWYRGSLVCQTCDGGSVPRERALAHVLNRVRPNWRDLIIHESSPAARGISRKMKQECKQYVGSHFIPDNPLGAVVGGYQNETLEDQTFDDESFDIIVTLDVFEHVWRPDKMMKEIYRTLKPGGIYICTFPVRKHQVESHRPRCSLKADGSIVHYEPEEIHGNPTTGEGALVTFDYGYAIHQQLECWAPFSVEVSRFMDRRLGIIGEYTEVFLCEKDVHRDPYLDYARPWPVGIPKKGNA